MKESSEHLRHALHNEEVCNHLSVKPEFSDWIITTAFYAALKFVSHKVFPFTVAAIEGKKTTINSIDEYAKYMSPLTAAKRKSKHELLSELVAKHCPEISDDYD